MSIFVLIGLEEYRYFYSLFEMYPVDTASKKVFARLSWGNVKGLCPNLLYGGTYFTIIYLILLVRVYSNPFLNEHASIDGHSQSCK